MSAVIHEIRTRADLAAHHRRILGRCVRSALQEHGTKLAGFALVSWDMRGAVVSSFLADSGPVARSLMPTFVHDALNRHLAVSMAKDCEERFFDEGA
jgi:hypothetical protein